MSSRDRGHGLNHRVNNQCAMGMISIHTFRHLLGESECLWACSECKNICASIHTITTEQLLVYRQPVVTPAVSGHRQPVATPAISGHRQPVATPAVSGHRQPVATPVISGLFHTWIFLKAGTVDSESVKAASSGEGYQIQFLVLLVQQ
ncbi:hypothetical protein BsWGS_24633 [Bradybaena similaris]